MGSPDDPTPLAPAFSVVIPVHNAAATLRTQLEALLSTIDPETEIVVVDNCSTDDSPRIVRTLAESHPALRLVSAGDRPGEAYARNVGVAAAHSGRIAFCDADDEVSPTWAAAARAALDHAPFVTGPVDVDRLNPEWLAGVRGRMIFSRQPMVAGSIPFAHGCNMAMRRSTFDALGGFDEAARIGTDVNFSIRAAHAGIHLAWADGMVMHYRHRREFRARWRQAVAYGRAAGHLRPLIPEPWGLFTRCAAQRRRAVYLVRSVPLLYRRERRVRWWWTLATVVGEIRGAER